jgi:hypothetical protein
VINVSDIKNHPFDDKEDLIVRYDKEKGLLIFKAEKDVEI